MAPETGGSVVQAEEQGAALALLPLAATVIYYVLPPGIQDSLLIQFTPQLVAYTALGLWTLRNSGVSARLGLTCGGIRPGGRWGILTGFVLGCVNTGVILLLIPSLGYDVAFLKTTPHAQIPFVLMVPWFIGAIAVFVEVNFRGFLLGRLAALESRFGKSTGRRRLSPLPVLASALAFAFDPFMVETFRHLHWIAVWDGLVWGAIWIRTHNLFITIIAHATEVIIMYCAVRAVLLP